LKGGKGGQGGGAGSETAYGEEKEREGFEKGKNLERGEGEPLKRINTQDKRDRPAKSGGGTHG